MTGAPESPSALSVQAPVKIAGPVGAFGLASGWGERSKFKTIVADPPWQITMHMGAGGRRTRKTEVPYSMMSVEEIKALPVATLAGDEAHLYLWTTRRYFREGIAAAVARAWGFEPCGELIWGLRNPGMGSFNGNGHEPILLASRGGLAWPKNALPAGVCFWRQPYRKGKNHGKDHSAKPDNLHDLAEEISPSPRIELFARSQRLGWSSWGNEALCHVELVPPNAEVCNVPPNGESKP